MINTASLAAFVVMPAHLAIYATTKAAIVALTESIREELGCERIGVTLLCPGPVRSRIHELALNTGHMHLSDAFMEAATRLATREISVSWMDPLEVGSLVLRAVLTDEPYVITHGEWRHKVTERMERLLAAMPQTDATHLLTSMRHDVKS